MMRTSRLVVPGAVLALLLATAAPAAAQSIERKLLRGVAGITTAFLEVPGNMYEETNERGAAGGLPLGFAIGCGMIVPRVLVSVYEILSAPLAYPAGYKPILEPEFPWGYFEGTTESRKRR